MSKTLSAALAATVISIAAFSPALALVRQPSPLQAECLKANPSDHLAYLDCIKGKKLEARKAAVERKAESAEPAAVNPYNSGDTTPAKTKPSPAGASGNVYPQTEAR